MPSGFGWGWTPEDEARVAGLDPLKADGPLKALPDLNAREDVPALTGLLGALLPTVEACQRFSLAESLAAMRDLGMVASSLRRHGAEPTEAVPGLEARLVLLGRKTAMVPRDTVFHYGPWNPAGPRQRMFTGSPHEDGLILSVRRSLPALDSALASLVEMSSLPPQDEGYASAGEEALASLQEMVAIIHRVKNEVSAAFFARDLRPYFEPYRVAGESYLGPAAAHVPLWLVDCLLWASDCDDPSLVHFFEEAARHSPPRHRHLYAQWRGVPSLLSELTRSLPDDVPEAHHGAETFAKLLRAVLTFRGKHRVIAAKAYDPELRLFPNGSGGYSLEFLDHGLSLTLDRSHLLRAWREGGMRRT